MGTFDTFLNKAKNVADVAAQKTGEVVEVSKVKLQAFKINNNIQRAYEKLGSIYYDSVKFDTNSDELLKSCVEEIDRLLQELETLNDSLGDIGKSSSIRCKSCGFDNTPGSFFCARCGAALDAAEADPLEGQPAEPAQPAQPAQPTEAQSEEIK